MANVWARDRARPFYLGYAALSVATVLIGFGPTYFLAGARGTLDIPWIVHVHGLAAMGWIGLLAAQVLLVRSGNSGRHRIIGRAGLPLALLIWSTGIMVGRWTVERDLPTIGEAAYAGFAGTASSLTVFLLLVIAALWMRRRPDWHKRLILLATMVVLWPAFFRFRHLLPFIPYPDVTLGFVLANSWILVAAVRDKLRWGCIHPVWLTVGPLVFVEQALELLFFITGWFVPVGRCLHGWAG